MIEGNPVGSYSAKKGGHCWRPNEGGAAGTINYRETCWKDCQCYSTRGGAKCKNSKCCYPRKTGETCSTDCDTPCANLLEKCKDGTCKSIYCHPTGSRVLTPDGDKQVQDVNVGDMVRGANGFEPVMLISHANNNIVAEYYAFDTASGRTLYISPGHYLYSNGNMVLPKDVRIGDELSTVDGSSVAPSTVSRVRTVAKTGAWHFYTASETLYVDGVLTSVLTNVETHSEWLMQSSRVTVGLLYNLAQMLGMTEHCKVSPAARAEYSSLRQHKCEPVAAVLYMASRELLGVLTSV